MRQHVFSPSRLLQGRTRSSAVVSILAVALLNPPAVCVATASVPLAQRLAGSTFSPFHALAGIAVVGPSAYVVEGNAIMAVDRVTGASTTVAGLADAPGSADGAGGSARFSGPHGLATDGTNLYVADAGNNTIREVTIATGEVTTLAGQAGAPGSADGVGGAARLNDPQGVAFGGSVLWVTDARNHTVRRFGLSSHKLVTIAGLPGVAGHVDATGSAARFQTLEGVAALGDGVYVADNASQSWVRRLSISTRAVTTVRRYRTGEEPTFLDGIAARNKSLYVGEPGRPALHRLNPTTGVDTVVARPFGANDAPAGVAADGPTVAYTDVAFRHQTIRSLDVPGGAWLSAGGWAENGSTDGTGPAARFSSQEELAKVGGMLYSADRDNNIIRAIDLSSGAVTTFVGSPGPCGGADGVGSAAQFCRPVGVATDGTRLFVSDSLGETVRAIDLATRAVSTLAGKFAARGSTDGTGHAARFAFPLGLSMQRGTLFVADGGNQTLRSVDLATRVVTTVAGTAGLIGSTDGVGPAARFDEPYGLASDGAHLFIGDALNCTLRAFDPVTAEVTTLAGTPLDCTGADGTGQSARFGTIGHLAYGGGAVYVADAGGFGQTAVRRVDLPTADVTTLTATYATPQPTKLGYTPSPAATTTVDAGGLAASPDGTQVWVTDDYGTGALTGL